MSRRARRQPRKRRATAPTLTGLRVRRAHGSWRATLHGSRRCSSRSSKDRASGIRMPLLTSTRKGRSRTSGGARTRRPERIRNPSTDSSCSAIPCCTPGTPAVLAAACPNRRELSRRQANGRDGNCTSAGESPRHLRQLVRRLGVLPMGPLDRRRFRNGIRLALAA